MNRTSRSILVAAAIVCASIAAAMTGAQPEHADQAKQAEHDGLAVARAYIAGMESADFEAVNALFLADGTSTVMENTSDEGTWANYRDHHLKPEMEATKDFKFTIATESQRHFGEAIIVRQVGSFTVEHDDGTRHYRAAVSYFMVMEEGEPRIAHLHWSSRADQRAKPQP